MSDFNELMEKECKKLFPDYPPEQWDKIGADFHVKGGVLNLSKKSAHNKSGRLLFERD